ncbi:MAG: RraA family protein [candidate division KSB1 bacterium]|nr:RraA family protein [candidate division KSB1 bacterium]
MRAVSICLGVIIATESFALAQQATPEALRRGIHFIPTHFYSADENQELLRLYQGLRVADVSDGMDRVGLPNKGLVDASIHPAWIDQDSLKHQFRGIALTVRYVPTQMKDRPEAGEEFSRWEGNFYNNYSSEPFTSIIEPGHVIVIDDDEFGDVGTIGSNNILVWHSKGAVAVVTDAGARDTDEVAKERVPLYLRQKSRGIRPGRNQLESVNRPVAVGGVLVCPGDVVVGDGDGVIVVPRAVARRVAEEARKILDEDKKARRNLYEQLGLPPDQTVH